MKTYKVMLVAQVGETFSITAPSREEAEQTANELFNPWEANEKQSYSQYTYDIIEEDER